MEVQIQVDKKIEVTKENFEEYERVRASGVTNMFDLRMVGMLSGLSKEKIKAIISNFEQLIEEYPDVYGKFSK